jgi:DNA-binding NtrC family response regulator
MVSAAQSSGRRGSVLIADNEPSVLLSTKRILEEDGWDVHTADSSGGILEAVRDNGFDLILVDHKMPGNENLQIVRVLGEEYPGCPVIVVTGYPSLPSGLQSFRMQVFDYLAKPFGTQALATQVRKVLDS